jgi:hypothetical protein
MLVTGKRIAYVFKKPGIIASVCKSAKGRKATGLHTSMARTVEIGIKAYNRKLGKWQRKGRKGNRNETRQSDTKRAGNACAAFLVARRYMLSRVETSIV